MRTFLWGLLLIAVSTLLPASALAQASIAGSTRDTSGAALPGVTVEASSPALIEKVRTAVTDERGLFRIVSLPPGTYSVTFALPGFNQVKRDGIELTGSFTAQIDAGMAVGGVTETITVTGASPIVDVQSIRRQTTISNEVLTSIPTARSWAATALLIPGIVTIGGGPTDIQVTPQMTVFGGAGGRNNEGRMQVDGLNAGAGLGGSGVSTYVADISNAQEVVTTTSGGLGEVEVGGPSLSIIPKSGGNTIRGAAYLSGVSKGMVGSNYSDELRAAGLTTPGKLLKQWDFTFGIGGPIMKDRLWYYVTARDEGQHRSIPNIFPNLNAGDPTKFLYAPDRTREVRGAESWRLYSARLTFQATLPQQDQPALGRTACVQRRHVHQQRRRVPPAAGVRSGVRSAWTGRPDLDDLARDRRLSGYPPSRAAAHLAVHGDQSHAVRSRVRRLPVALRPEGEPRQHHPRSRAHHRAVCRRVLAEWRHSQPDVSLGELGTQLGRAVHLAGVGLLRDRRPQPEDRLRRRGPGLGSREPHQRSQPPLHGQQRHADLAHPEPAAVHHQLSDPQRVLLRAGSVDARAHDASGRPALRSQLELLTRTDDSGIGLPRLAAGLPGNARRDRLQRHLPARRRRLRRVRQRQDGGEGELRQIPGADEQQQQLHPVEPDHPHRDDERSAGGPIRTATSCRTATCGIRRRRT